MGSANVKYLYHGSQYLFDVLKPQRACGESESCSMLAIYASDVLDWVIPFALPIRWFPDDPSGKRVFTCNEGRTIIEYGSLNPNGIGYVYKMKAAGFRKIDNWQWISENEVKPDEIIQIKVSDHWHTVAFSEEAERINRKLYEYWYTGGRGEV